MPEPTPSAAASGAPAATTETPAHAPRPVSVSASEKDALAMRWAGDHGSAEAALRKKAGQTLLYHKRAQEAERQAAELRKLLPPEGAVVLTGEEAKAYADLKTKNITLDKVPGMLSEAQTLSARAAADKRSADLTTAAGSKYKKGILARLLGDSPDGKTVGLPIEIKTTMVKEGDTVKEEPTAYVKVGDTLELLDTYLEREQKDWMEVLRVKEGDETSTTSASSSGAGSTSTTTGTTTTMPKQTGSNSSSRGTPAPKGNVAQVDKILAQKYQTPSQRRAAQNGGGGHS